MAMQSRSSAALCLALLLCACGTENGNQAANGAESNSVAELAAQSPNRADSAGRPGATPPSQALGSGAQAPEPSGDVTLLAAPARVSEGATVTLTLRNGSRERVGYNLCTSDLQTSAGRSVPTSRVCTMELRTLEPGGTADHRYKLPLNMPGGSYRFVTQVEWMQSGRRDGVESNSFEVR